MSAAELIESAAVRLRAAGVSKPRREAHRLWAWLNRASPGEAYLTREQAIASDVAEAFGEAVARRLAGEPLAYVLGHAGFRHQEILCDARALIPRPETEGVVDHALQRVQQGSALDLGTGTGCLALALSQEGRFDVIIAVDLSDAALALARENARRTGQRVDFVQGDFGAGLRHGSFDLVVANPPYLTEAEYAMLDAAVRDWEPSLALVSGADGLEATRRVLLDANGLLAPSGTLVMELDSTRSGKVAALAAEAGYREVAVWDDLFGRPRYLTACRG